MNRFRSLAKFVAVLFLGIALATSAQQPKPQPHHDGNWWRNKSSQYHEAFISGYKSGIHHATGRETDVYNFTSEELVTGVDKFFDDFRNRNISFDDALLYVADQFRGVPDDKLAARILKMRAAASATNANNE